MRDRSDDDEHPWRQAGSDNLTQVPFQNVEETNNHPAPSQKGVENGNGFQTDTTKKTWNPKNLFWILIPFVIFAICLVTLPTLKPSSQTNRTTSTTGCKYRDLPPRQPFNFQILVGKRWELASEILEGFGWNSGDYVKQMASGTQVSDDWKWTVTSVTSDAKPVITLQETASVQKDPNTEPPAKYVKALSLADTYANKYHYSRLRVFENLSTGKDKVSPDAARYAWDHVTADFNANALAEARTEKYYSCASDTEVRESLSRTDSAFTPDEIDYAMEHLNDQQ